MPPRARGIGIGQLAVTGVGNGINSEDDKGGGPIDNILYNACEAMDRFDYLCVVFCTEVIHTLLRTHQPETILT